MTKKLENKVALITGGSSGIGSATAKRFIAEGALVVIAARRQEQLDAAVHELGHNAMGVKTDVSKLTDLDELMGQIRQRHGRLDIVFANAGGGGGGGPRPLQQLTEQDYYGVFDQNVKTVLFTVQKSLPFARRWRSDSADHLDCQRKRATRRERLWRGQGGRAIICA